MSRNRLDKLEKGLSYVNDINEFYLHLNRLELLNTQSASLHRSKAFQL